MGEAQPAQRGTNNDALSIREVAELLKVTRHRVIVACALAG